MLPLGRYSSCCCLAAWDGMVCEGALDAGDGDESYGEPTHAPLKGIPKISTYFGGSKVGIKRVSSRTRL